MKEIAFSSKSKAVYMHSHLGNVFLANKAILMTMEFAEMFPMI